MCAGCWLDLHEVNNTYCSNVCASACKRRLKFGRAHLSPKHHGNFNSASDNRPIINKSWNGTAKVDPIGSQHNIFFASLAFVSFNHSRVPLLHYADVTSLPYSSATDVINFVRRMFR